MFNKIGKKIKSLAKLHFTVFTLAAFIGSITVMTLDEDLIPLGLIIMFGGAFIAWLSSLFVYGFGEIIDKLCDIEYNTRDKKRFKKQVVVKASDTDFMPTEERLAHLNSLCVRGLITEEEYQQVISKSLYETSKR